MSTTISTTTDNSTELPDNTYDDEPFIGSGIYEKENFLTDKERSVLLATSALLNSNEEISFSKIATHAGVANSYPRYVLSKFMQRHELPAACIAMKRCTPTVTYHDLTDKQRQVINEMVVNPELTDLQISEIVDCTDSYVYQIRLVYGDMIQSRREEICS